MAPGNLLLPLGDGAQCIPAIHRILVECTVWGPEMTAIEEAIGQVNTLDKSRDHKQHCQARPSQRPRVAQQLDLTCKTSACGPDRGKHRSFIKLQTVDNPT